MTDGGKAAEALYARLVLRDLFGRVAPGALLLSAWIGAYTGADGLLRRIGDLPLGAWLILFGFAWIVGMAIRAFGDFTSLTRPSLSAVAEACGTGYVALSLAVVSLLLHGLLTLPLPRFVETLFLNPHAVLLTLGLIACLAAAHFRLAGQTAGETLD
jgi:hypothetical protein